MNKMLIHVLVFSYKKLKSIGNSLVYQYTVSFLLSIQGVQLSDYKWKHDNKKNQEKLHTLFIIVFISSLWIPNASKEKKNRIKVT